MSLPPIRDDSRAGEEEPLLGAPGANTQTAGAPLWHNLVSGTAPIAQVGGVALAAVVAGAVFSHPLMLFSAHPLLNVAGIAVLLQSALILQPTHTPEQKRAGAITHSVLNGTAMALMFSAAIVIVVNKLNHHGAHFESTHAILGLLTYIALFLQLTVGVVQYYFPQLIGGVDNAKSLYKYHRISGYSIVLLILSTVVAATYTDYNKTVLHIRTWAVVASGVLVLAGALPRVKLSKLGFATN